MRLPAIDARKRRMAAGALLLMTSAGAGFAAYDQSMVDSLAGWKRGHFPSRGAWIHSLGELGYREISDAGDRARALRTLPAQLDSDGSVWASTDATWIAVFGSPEHGLSAEAYCLACKAPAHSWRPLGSGWDGFDSALEDARKAARVARPGPKKRTEEPHDPREIRY